MALTVNEKKELLAALDRTGAEVAAGKAEKEVTAEYLAYGEQVERAAVTLPVPEAGVPVTCYITTAKDREADCPVFVNMHGGGFVFLQDQDDDMFCARIAAEIRGIVVDIDYASSIDHPYPTAFEQSYQVMRWVFSQCAQWKASPQKVSMGGHSAGGCLVAAIALKAAATGDFKVCLQILDYAAIDNYAPFADENGAERSQVFSLLYADGDKELLKDPYVSPIFAGVELMKDQPRTLIVNGQSCPFCQANETYGMHLIQAGTEVTMKRFINSRHGFTVRLVDEWREAQELIIREIRNASKG